MLTAFAAIFIFVSVSGQNDAKIQGKLKVFIDCSSTWCDMSFIRTEINLVDFLLDRVAADVHVLVTEQNTGSGGSSYQLIFFGQNSFKNQQDTLHFNTDPNATDFEERDMLIKYMKLGLAPYVAKTTAAKDVVISFKRSSEEIDNKETVTNTVKDPWNYWVFRVGTNGSINLDAVYKESRFSGNLSANRITEESKIGFELNGGKNKSDFEYEDDLGNVTKFTNRNNNYEFNHYFVKNINPHWSWAYELKGSRNTFSNNKFRSMLSAGVEYNIFPYKLVNTKSFTIAYTADVRRNNYIDTTLYDKAKETLAGHGLEAKLSVNQKWGSVEFGSEYHNYFHNWKFFSLEAYTQLDIRITGGLSFNIYASAQLTRDQIFHPKEGETPQQ